MSFHEAYDKYHGNKGDDEGAPKPLRDLNNGESKSFIPIEEVPDPSGLDPEAALIAAEEGEKDSQYIDDESELPQPTEDDHLPDHSQEVAHLKSEKESYVAPMPDPRDDVMPSQSGATERTPEPYFTEGLLGRSTGHRGREPKNKNKRLSA